MYYWRGDSPLRPMNSDTPEAGVVQWFAEVPSSTPGALDWLAAVLPGPHGLPAVLTRTGLLYRHLASGFSIEVPTLWSAQLVEPDWIRFGADMPVPWVGVTIHPPNVGEQAKAPLDLLKIELGHAENLSGFELLSTTQGQLQYGRTAVPAAIAHTQYVGIVGTDLHAHIHAVMLCVLSQRRAFTVMAETLSEEVESNKEVLGRILSSFSLDEDVERVDLASPANRSVLPFIYGLAPDSELTRAEFDLLNQKMMDLPMVAPDGRALGMGARLRISKRTASELPQTSAIRAPSPVDTHRLAVPSASPGSMGQRKLAAYLTRLLKGIRKSPPGG
jgi:hypothetical protein